MMPYSRGFTLIELMVTIAVVAIVITIAAPNFSQQIRNSQSVALADQFSEAVIFARTQAISRSTKVSICASEDSVSCTGDWVDGYIVFTDAAASDESLIASVDTVLKVVKFDDANVNIKVTYGTSESKLIRFTSLGVLARISADPLVIKTKSTNCKGDSARSIGINLTGQITSQSLSCSGSF